MMKLGRHSLVYESEFGRFIDAMHRVYPDLTRQQAEARAIWWDRPPLSVQQIDAEQKEQVKLKPYVYD